MPEYLHYLGGIVSNTITWSSGYLKPWAAPGLLLPHALTAVAGSWNASMCPITFHQLAGNVLIGFPVSHIQTHTHTSRDSGKTSQSNSLFLPELTSLNKILIGSGGCWQTSKAGNPGWRGTELGDTSFHHGRDSRLLVNKENIWQP